jgi:hypothetical protein
VKGLTAGKTKNQSFQRGKRYSDQVVAQGLAIYDIEGNIDDTAKQMGVDKATVRKWINNRHKYESGNSVTRAETFAQLYERQKDAILAECVEIQKLALQQVRAKIGGASAYQAALIFGILHDKINNTGKYGSQEHGNTTNILISNMNQEEAMELMQRVMERANNSGQKPE